MNILQLDLRIGEFDFFKVKLMQEMPISFHFEISCNLKDNLFIYRFYDIFP